MLDCILYPVTRQKNYLRLMLDLLLLPVISVCVCVCVCVRVCVCVCVGFELFSTEEGGITYLELLPLCSRRRGLV